MNRREFLAVTAVSVPLIAGCGGDGGGDSPTPSPTAQSTETATPTKAGTSTPTPTPGGGGTTTSTPTQDGAKTTTSASVGQREYPDYNWNVLEDANPEFTAEIVQRDTQFHPLIAEVPRGMSIPFTNEDSFGHTLTIPALDIDEQLSGGASTTVTFDELETYDYVCRLHPPSMLGRIVVVDRTPTPTTEGTTTTAATTTTTDGDGGGGGYY